MFSGAVDNYPQFTVTRVDGDPASSDGSIISDKRVLIDGGAANSVTSPSESAHQLSVPASTRGGGASSDNESWYGDTLTQTSITKLLSDKFRVSDDVDLRTCSQHHHWPSLCSCIFMQARFRAVEMDIGSNSYCGQQLV